MNKKQIINSIFYPRQSNIPMDEKDHIVSTFDGEKVGIRLFLKDKNLPTILFFHGNAELAQEYDDLAEFYNKFDMNFIVADYRGYGLSSGSPNKENLHEDSKTIFKYAKKYLNKKIMMIIYTLWEDHLVAAQHLKSLTHLVTQLKAVL